MKKSKSILTLLFILIICNIVSAQIDYILGKIEYERRDGTEIEKANSRKSGLEKIKSDSDSGNSYAQHYLATIYLTDTLYIDTLKAIELLKKSAYQRNSKAAIKLNELDVTDFIVPLDYQYWKRVLFYCLIIFGYLLLSTVSLNKISSSQYITTQRKKDLKKMVWFLPIVGALLGIRKSKKIVQPINSGDINWVKSNFTWISNNFPSGLIQRKNVITPIDLKELFSNISKNETKTLVSKISSIMDIEKSVVSLDFYEERSHDPFGEIEIRQFETIENSTGKYYGVNESGKYLIALEVNLLSRPTNLIATIAHELAHVKLLGEKRIEENDEYLTDLIPIVYGLGIFGANSIFNSETNNYYWSMARQGYLDEKVYAFALAWYSSLRKESNPSWKKYLKPSMLNEFETSILYIEKGKSR